MLINALVLALSFFNTICLLWLGLMVLLIGNRRSPGVWLTGSGMLLGALFFTSHTAIIGRGLGDMSFGMNFWWWVSWTPAIAAPLAWYCAMFWYSGVGLRRWHVHHLGLLANLALALGMVALLLFANPLPTYEYVAGRELALAPGIAGIPYLVLAYLLYSLLCYLLSLGLVNRDPAGQAGGADRRVRAHQRARPWLTSASLALLLAGGGLAWAALWALNTRPLPSLTDPAAQLAVLRFDLLVQVLVGLAATLLGRAVVGFEVFTGRAMPRGRFFRYWRSALLLAGGFGAAAAFSLAVELRPIYSLMLAAALVVAFYALQSWRTFAEREDFMTRLRPFIASQDLYGHMTGDQEQPARKPANPSAQFQALCAGLLDVRAGLLIPSGPLATLAGPGLFYPAGAPLPPAHQLAELSAALQAGRKDALLSTTAQQRLPAGYDWAVPLWSAPAAPAAGERRLSGLLLLAEKPGRAPLIEEEMQIAQAAGERLVDSLAAAEMARLALDLLGQRLAQTRVLEGQGRRVLHDEVLPELHAAILYLSEQAGASSGAVDAAIGQLSAVHRRISDLMRELPLATPHRLASGGLAEALPALLEGPLGGEFERVTWQIEPAAAEAARALPLFSAEVLYFAARELVRNAARHGRGTSQKADRPLSLWISLTLRDAQLVLAVEDDGVGLEAAGQPAGFSAGSGLRMHTALLAAIGASLELSPRPAGGLTSLIKKDVA